MNFVTDTTLDGFEVSADYEFLDGSDGNLNASLRYGKQWENGNWVTTLGYNSRSELSTLERDWAVQSFADAPLGGWSTIGNPGSFVALPNVGPGTAAAGTALAFANSDDQCDLLGGTDGGVLCRFNFTQFDNLIEEEERYQLFSEINYAFGGMDFHAEALYAYTEVPEWKTSPSYPPQELFGQIVAPDHPGLLQYIADNPAWAAATFTDFAPLLVGGAPDVYDPVTGTGGLDPATTPLIFFGRTFGNGGFPGTGGGAQEGYREAETMRFAGSLSGAFEGGTGWDIALSYSSQESTAITNDTYVGGLSAALAGFGLCADPVTGTPNPGAVAGQGGCEYYNPFSNAIQETFRGVTNPQFDPALANSLALADWLTDPLATTNSASLLVFDITFDGQLGWEMGGGNVQWQAGGQLRHEDYEVDPNDNADLAINPGASGNGAFAFLAGTNAYKDSQNIFGGFAEFVFPVTEDLEVRAAARYEKYRGDVGQTFDPKVAFKWQATPVFALRGSAQTSFRGPTLNQLGSRNTTLEFISPTGAFKAVDTVGNPDLEPETATTLGLGGIVQTDNFNFTIDYYNIALEDTIIVEDKDAVVAAALAALGDPNAPQGILGQVLFDGGVQSAGTISRISTNIINGPDIDTSGIDVRADYTFANLYGADVTIGGDATFILEYDVGEYVIADAVIPAVDALGQLNRNNFGRPVPELKANLFANYARGMHNFRADLRYIDEYTDQRSGASIDSFVTLDLTYNIDFEDYGFRGFISAQNVTDEDPPFAALDLNYDPYTHSPYGRVLKIGATKTFDFN